jgi:NTP pyrophosphatase (non-canonical NTP hydrolase)
MAIQQDAARHQHLSEEIADVLLYLVQIADHSGIDIAAAVERKLALNAVKHPVPSLSCGMQANLT